MTAPRGITRRVRSFHSVRSHITTRSRWELAPVWRRNLPSHSRCSLSLSLFLFYHLSRLAHKRIGKNYFLIYYIRGRMYHDVERTPMRSVDRDGRAGVITAIAGFMLFFSLSFCWPFLPFFCCGGLLFFFPSSSACVGTPRLHQSCAHRPKRARAPLTEPFALSPTTTTGEPTK